MICEVTGAVWGEGREKSESANKMEFDKCGAKWSVVDGIDEM